MNLYEMTVEAQEKLDTFRNPNIDDWVDAIINVLEAMGKNSLRRSDEITAIRIYGDYFQYPRVEIDTTYSYYCRGCSQLNTHSIPLAIIKAENPVKAAKVHALSVGIEASEKRLAAIAGEIESLHNKQHLLKETIKLLKDKLDAIQN